MFLGSRASRKKWFLAGVHQVRLLPGRRLMGESSAGSGLGNVFSYQAAFVFLDIECDFLTFGKSLETGHGYGREMYEHVPSIFLGDEAVSLSLIEPFYSPFSHSRTSFQTVTHSLVSGLKFAKGKILSDKTDLEHTGP
jgi:hypothetical protein